MTRTFAYCLNCGNKTPMSEAAESLDNSVLCSECAKQGFSLQHGVVVVRLTSIDLTKPVDNESYVRIDE